MLHSALSPMSKHHRRSRLGFKWYLVHPPSSELRFNATDGIECRNRDTVTMIRHWSSSWHPAFQKFGVVARDVLTDRQRHYRVLLPQFQPGDLFHDVINIRGYARAVDGLRKELRNFLLIHVLP